MQLIKQRFSYFRIDLVRDNCMLSEDRPIPIVVSDGKELDDDFLFTERVETLEPVVNKDTKFETIKLEPRPSKGARTKYFYGEKEKEYVSFIKLTKEPCYTTSEKHLKRHYGNPFASIQVVTFERTIELREGKLYIRCYKNTRYRDFNWKYFRKSSKVMTLTIDLHKGDFTIGDMNFGKMKSKRFRKNSFTTLEILLGSNSLFNLKKEFSNNLKIAKQFDDTFNEHEFINVIKNHIPNLPTNVGNLFDKHFFITSFIEFFAEKKKIKTPNDFVPLIKIHYPTEKYLKKNQRKLMQSILDSYGINSKFTLKLFHENPKLNLQEFSCMCDLLGKDYPKYLGSLKSECFNLFMIDNGNAHSMVPLELRGAKNHHRHLFIDNVDRENIIKILNSLTPKPAGDHSVASVTRGIYTLIKDHFDMIEKIREFDPNIKMRATNYTDFHTEHIEISKTCSLIKKGWSIEYQYDNRMVRLVEEQIKTQFENDNHIFSPVILKREEEYSEEGTFMHHCVASYANKESSMIISLRTNGGSDRVTCEFNKKTGDCIQERHFCNKLPPEYFGESLEILKQRVRKFAGQRLLNHIDIKKVKVKINGKEVNQREPDLFEQLMNGDIEF